MGPDASIVVMSVHLHPFFVYTSNGDSGQCVHVRTLAWPFVVETAIGINMGFAGPC